MIEEEQNRRRREEIFLTIMFIQQMVADIFSFRATRIRLQGNGEQDET